MLGGGLLGSSGGGDGGGGLGGGGDGRGVCRTVNLYLVAAVRYSAVYGESTSSR